MMRGPITVLMVDGHPVIRSALADRMRLAPAIKAVKTAGTLDAAARLAREMGPDVVLYDPRTVSGDATAALHALGRDGRIVVVLTAHLFDIDAESLRRAGAAAILLKALPLPDLLREIATVVRPAA